MTNYATIRKLSCPKANLRSHYIHPDTATAIEDVCINQPDLFDAIWEANWVSDHRNTSLTRQTARIYKGRSESSSMLKRQKTQVYIGGISPHRTASFLLVKRAGSAQDTSLVHTSAVLVRIVRSPSVQNATVIPNEAVTNGPSV